MVTAAATAAGASRSWAQHPRCWRHSCSIHPDHPPAVDLGLSGPSPILTATLAAAKRLRYSTVALLSSPPSLPSPPPSRHRKSHLPPMWPTSPLLLPLQLKTLHCRPIAPLPHHRPSVPLAPFGPISHHSRRITVSHPAPPIPPPPPGVAPSHTTAGPTNIFRCGFRQSSQLPLLSTTGSNPCLHPNVSLHNHPLSLSSPPSSPPHVERRRQQRRAVWPYPQYFSSPLSPLLLRPRPYQRAARRWGRPRSPCDPSVPAGLGSRPAATAPVSTNSLVSDPVTTCTPAADSHAATYTLYSAPLPSPPRRQEYSKATVR